MAWEVRIQPTAGKQIERLDRSVARRIVGHLEKLAENPYPSGIKKLAGEENLFRARVGDWRIIYQVQDKLFLVLVIKVGHRKDVYRKLS